MASNTQAHTIHELRSNAMIAQDQKSAPRLATVPVELQKMILDQVPRVTDLKDLCLVSKEHHTLVMPFLYFDMQVKVAKLDQRFHSRFTSNHPGLPLIRMLHIRAYEGFSVEQHMPIIYDLLDQFKQDQLRFFKFDTNKPVPLKLNRLLLAKQTRLVNHQHYSLSRIEPGKRLIPNMDDLPHVTSLQLFLHTREDFVNGGLLLERMQGITSLDLHVCGPNRMVTQKLFRNGNPASRCPNLKRLRFTSMSFFNYGAILPTMLTFNNLEHLQLINCDYTNCLWDILTQIKPPLQSFCDIGYKNGTWQPVCNKFLRTLEPLQKLRISSDRFMTEDSDAFSWAALYAHAKTLQCLEVNDNDFEDWPHESTKVLPQFRRFCKRATQLEELAMYGPSVKASEEKYTKGWNDWDTVLDSISYLPNLRLLKLYCPTKMTDLVWDDLIDCPPNKQCLKDKRAHTVAGLFGRKIADNIFKTLAHHCPKLESVALQFYMDDGIDYEDFHFLRLETWARFANRMQYTGVKAGKQWLRDYESDSSILNNAEEELSSEI
ncbi:hypothetical protein Q7P37_003893 [Cladosporium fusiforme]